MIRKFSFWIVATTIVSVGLMVMIHWQTLRSLHDTPSAMQVLYQRQKVLTDLNLSLEKYRRMSGNFRKAAPEEVEASKSSLRSSFSKGLSSLGKLNPTAEEKAMERKINDQLTEFLNLIAQVEPSLFSKDAYKKQEVLDLHEQLIGTLQELGRFEDQRLQNVESDTAKMESRSIILLLGAGTLILVLTIGLILRHYLTYVRPLNRLRDYAAELGLGKSLPTHLPDFPGAFGDIQRVLNQLAQGVETHMRDRHKFILDVVEDLRAPLAMLQSAESLVKSDEANAQATDLLATEAVRRGLAIVSGSLDDLNDIVDINRLESRLDERTVDLSDLLSDVVRVLIGTDYGKKIQISVPPIPVWVKVDVKRIQRVLILVLSKVMDTVTEMGAGLTLTVSNTNQANFRGIEILVQESGKQKQGRTSGGGPEQDILRHWMSETGLSMLLAHKVIKAHGGTLTAAGVAGTSVSVMIRLPQERIISRGLISPPVSAGPSAAVSTAPTVMATQAEAAAPSGLRSETKPNPGSGELRHQAKA